MADTLRFVSGPAARHRERPENSNAGRVSGWYCNSDRGRFVVRLARQFGVLDEVAKAPDCATVSR